jgi:hypothetical protein
MSPMDKAHNAPRCTARSKRSGQRCRAPAVGGWRVCRMHGAHVGAPEGERNGNYRHGARTKEATELRKLIRRLGSLGCSGGESVLVSDRTTTDALHGVDVHFDFVPPDECDDTMFHHTTDEHQAHCRNRPLHSFSPLRKPIDIAALELGRLPQHSDEPNLLTSRCARVAGGFDAIWYVCRRHSRLPFCK